MAFTLITAENGVKYIRSTMLTAKHGFATRIGGVSKEAHTASLNLSFDRGDEDKTVIENLRLFSDAVGVSAESVISHPQIHSTNVMYADESNAGEGYFVKTDVGLDGYVTDKKGVTLGVKTADCVPVLLEDAGAGVIAAVHAGWRGTAAGIAREAVMKMVSLGANTADIKVAIGPAINYCCYEVGEDFRESVKELAGSQLAAEFIRKSGEKLHADIVGLNRRILMEAGVRGRNIDLCRICTCCHPELFYSHRYSNGVRGTMLSVITM